MAKLLSDTLFSSQGLYKDLMGEEVVPAWFERRGGSRWVWAHFEHSSTCHGARLVGDELPRRLDGTRIRVMTVGDLVTTYAMGINLCTECFGGKGVDCIKAWAETATAPEAWGTLLVRFEIVGLAERCEHVRKGLVQEHAFGAKEAPVVARKITKMRTLLAGLSVQAREAHQVAIDRFEESADALMALVSPAQSEYALESLRAKLHSGRYAWVVLDETPTVLAIEGNANWRVHQVKLAPELIAAMTISETANKGIVLYGPRFAMEYLMRAWGESNAYMVATTEDDAEVAKLAGGIWGIGSGIDDLFCALETARSLVHA